MKIRVISTALLMLAAGSAFAQMPGPPPGGIERNIEKLTILLDLDAGQQVAVQKVLDEQRDQMKTLRHKGKSSDEWPSREQMEQMHAQHEQLQQETVEKLRGILSDTQLKKYEVLAESRRVMFMRRGKGKHVDE